MKTENENKNIRNGLQLIRTVPKENTKKTTKENCFLSYFGWIEMNLQAYHRDSLGTVFHG